MTRALVLSGGGSKGQFHVGAVQYLWGERSIQHDTICGVSVGALVAAFLAQYPIGEEKEAYEGLLDIFAEVENKDIWKHWFPFRYAHGLWKGGIMDSRPLRELINTRLDPEKVRNSGRKLRIGATSLNTGQYRVFTEQDAPLKDIVYASAAFPVAFSPVKIGGQWWSDGGIRTVTPIKSAIHSGADTLDVIMTSPAFSIPRFNPDPNAVEVALRTIELQIDQIFDDDLKKALLYNRLVEAGAEGDKRKIEFNVSRPAGLLNENSLKFVKKEAAICRLRGYLKTKEVIESNGTNYSGDY